MNNLVKHFISKHLQTNIIFIGVLIVAIFAWQKIGKEEMPEFESDWFRVSAVYPGAPAEDVELFVTKPIEEELKGLIGIYEIKSTSSMGRGSFIIKIDPDYPNKKEVIQEVKDAVLRVNLTREVDTPTFRQFKSTEKAIIDIALINKNTKYLNTEQRRELQKYTLSFENQLTTLKEISSIDKSGYLLPELQILLNPENLKRYQISISEIYKQIRANNIRVPIGSMNDKEESKVIAVNELEDVESLKNLILRGAYDGPSIKLGEIAEIKDGFEKKTKINKIQGHEGIILNVKKSISFDILTAEAQVQKFVNNFNKANPNSPVEIILMDDESFDVTNRLSIIKNNGLLGFALILIVLFIFLDFKSGFWVAMGIPFTLAFTIIISKLTGYTVNNMTLAGIIIVMGIVVDDAVIIAENISRHKDMGKPWIDAAQDGCEEVVVPILASVITTIVAFIPLLYFEGWFGKFVVYIPLMVFLMLSASLLESLFILPSHMVSAVPFIGSWKIFDRPKKESWFFKYERKYAKVLEKFLNLKAIIYLFFIILLIGASFVFKKKMKFVMFPREESKEVHIVAETDEGSTLLKTAKAMDELEQMFLKEGKKVVVAVRTRVGQSRRGGEVKEHQASLRVELVPADLRNVPLKVLRKRWEVNGNKIKGIKKIKIFRSWWGRGDGSPIELRVQENNDVSRKEISETIKKSLEGLKSITNVEIEKPIVRREYVFHINQKSLIKFNINPTNITTSLRTFVEGSILYTINKGDEEVDVRLTVPNKEKINLNELLNLKIENGEGQLTHLHKLVKVKETKKPSNIVRINYKRTTMVHADLDKDATKTPLEIANFLETQIFPKIIQKYPSSILAFTGEIEDSRQTESEFRMSIILIVIIIYFILIFTFNSLVSPLIILSIVPFGMAGSILILFAHGMEVYGFFAIIGALGMIGVVINDSIIMMSKLEKENIGIGSNISKAISEVCSTRLRPVLVTTLTTVAAVLPTAYGIAGYDSMLAEMMLTMGWGLAFSTLITLVLVPCLYTTYTKLKLKYKVW